jgi:hypothetical protein
VKYAVLRVSLAVLLTTARALAEVEPDGSDGAALDVQDEHEDFGSPGSSPGVGASRARLPWGPDFQALANAPEFLPRSYVYGSTPVGSAGHRATLVFAAEYALHLPLFNMLRDSATSGRPWALSVTPFFRGDLRMVAANSKPVRMPSYKPGLAIQGFWLHTLAPSWRLIGGLRFEGYHYSNGQERCTWDEELDDVDLDAMPSGLCTQRFQNLLDPAEELNRSSGEFSTNRLLLGVDAKVYKLDANRMPYQTWSAGITLESNRPNAPGGIASVYRDVYGWGTLELHAELENWCFTTLLTRLRTVFNYAIDDGTNIPSAAGSVEVAFYPVPRFTSQVGIFARYYGGRDFYNAFFVDAVQVGQLGLVFDSNPPIAFR